MIEWIKGTASHLAAWFSSGVGLGAGVALVIMWSVAAWAAWCLVRMNKHDEDDYDAF